MATPYVMSKVTSCYFPCESDADLPDCCKDVSKSCSQRYAAPYASWCPVCKDDAGGGAGGGAMRRCCSKGRRRSLSETTEPATDPLREHNRSYDSWKLQQRAPAKGAAYEAHNYAHGPQRPFDAEFFERGDVEENMDHGRICPTKRLKERLLPFCSLTHDYEQDSTNGGVFRVHDLPPEGRSMAQRCRLEIAPQKVTIDGPFPLRRERHAPAPGVLARRLRNSPPAAGEAASSPSPAPSLSRSPSPPVKSPPQLPAAALADRSSITGCFPAAKRPMAGTRSPPPVREPSPQKRGCPEWRGASSVSMLARSPASPPPGARLPRSLSRSPENRAPSPPPPAARGDFVRGPPACCDVRRPAEDCCCCNGCKFPPQGVKAQSSEVLPPPSPAPRSPSPSNPPPLRHAASSMVRTACGGGASQPPLVAARHAPAPAQRGGNNPAAAAARAPFAGKSSHGLAPYPTSPPPAPHPTRRSLSPPGCLTVEYAATAAAAAAAKAQQHSLHHQLHPSRGQQQHGKRAATHHGGAGDPPAHFRHHQRGPEQAQRNIVQHHVADMEVLRSRLRDLRGSTSPSTAYAPAPVPASNPPASSTPAHSTSAPAAAAEGKRQRPRGEADLGHGSTPVTAPPPRTAATPLSPAVASAPGSQHPQAHEEVARPRGGGGGGQEDVPPHLARSSHHRHRHQRHRHSQPNNSRDAKRARDASPPSLLHPHPHPHSHHPHSQQQQAGLHPRRSSHHDAQPDARPELQLDAHHDAHRALRRVLQCPQPKKDLSPNRRLNKIYPRKRSPIQVVHCHDSSDSDYEDQIVDYDSKDITAEDSEEDCQSIVSGMTTASSNGSVTPSIVGETLGAISLSDVAISITNPPRAPVKPLTPPHPPQGYPRRKQDFPRSLRGSLFSHVPPYIRFSMHDSKGENLPPELAAVLKWKLSTITPVVVRRTLVNSGFRLVRSECSFTESNEWSGTWGKHMKSLCFRTLKEFQKINHFPGTFQIGRKDRLWKNLYRLMTKFGRKEFGFIPRTYVLPQDSKLLRQAWEKNCGREKWIIKPPASARGAGIKVIHRWAQIPKKRPLVVQKYIADPYLINGSKFDLRLYVLVTSMNPMRVYIYDDGLVRFASVKYSGEMSTLHDRYMHLTNYSINKLSSVYTQNEDASACQGHKWTVKTLWSYMEKLGVDIPRLWDTLVDLCIKTIISGETAISQLTRTNLPSRYCSYELFGIDVLLDESLKPWLLEVNISPSLHSASPLDLAVKGPLVKDLMNLAGYHVPNKLLASQTDELLTSFGVSRDRISTLCFDRRLYTTLLSQEERQKHHLYQSFTERDEYLNDVIETLTPDDVRHLIQAEDELTQAGRFIRIFPTPDTWIYLEYFESPTYYNRLFDAWETKYHDNRQAGIERLEALCRKKHHLMVPPATGSAKFSVNPQVLLADDAAGVMGIELEKKCIEENHLPESYSRSAFAAGKPHAALLLGAAADASCRTSLPARMRMLPGPENAAQRPCRRMFASALMGYLGLAEANVAPEEKLAFGDGVQLKGEKSEGSGSTRKGSEMKGRGDRKRSEDPSKLLTLSSVALYRAARPRSGKPGVVLKPFPRSSYVSRKPRTGMPNGPSPGASSAASLAPSGTGGRAAGDGNTGGAAVAPSAAAGEDETSGEQARPLRRSPSSPVASPTPKDLHDYFQQATAAAAAAVATSPSRLRRAPDDPGHGHGDAPAAHPLPEGTACPC